MAGGDSDSGSDSEGGGRQARFGRKRPHGGGGALPLQGAPSAKQAREALLLAPVGRGGGRGGDGKKNKGQGKGKGAGSGS